MSSVCAEARGTVTCRSTVITGVVVRHARVRRRDARIDQFCCASRVVACRRGLRANRPTLRPLRGSRTHRGSREAREDREGPRGTAISGMVVRRAPVRRRNARISHFRCFSRLAKLFVAYNKADVRVMLWPR